MRYLLIAGIILISLILACSLIYIGYQAFFAPTETEEMVQTAVAMTVAANIQVQPSDTPIPQTLPTLTPFPTYTLPVAATAMPKPCNVAEFISETIPDNTVMDPSKSFTKTWRFKNIGTCTWDTNYKIVFSDGAKMSGVSPQKFEDDVAPGEKVDIAVDLKAPATSGTYRGYWKLQDDEGAYFVNNMWVQIKVSAPLVENSVTLNVKSSESGTVWESGDVNAGDIAAGDAATNAGVQAFVSFDISGIPSNAKILSVKMDLSDYAILGNPFGLGCLRMYEQAYRPLDAGDYFTGSPSGALMKWCNTGELDTVSADEDVKNALQTRLGNTYFPLRLQFNETETNNNGVNDTAGWNSLKLIVKYES
jgi:hypothetical protein